MTDPETTNALWGLGLAVLIVAAVLLRIAFRQTRPMATWKRKGFRDYGDAPIDDSRDSITTFKRMHRP